MLSVAVDIWSMLGRGSGGGGASAPWIVTATGGEGEFTLNRMPQISDPDVTPGWGGFIINTMPEISTPEAA